MHPKTGLPGLYSTQVRYPWIRIGMASLTSGKPPTVSIPPMQPMGPQQPQMGTPGWNTTWTAWWLPSWRRVSKEAYRRVIPSVPLYLPTPTWYYRKPPTPVLSELLPPGPSMADMPYPTTTVKHMPPARSRASSFPGMSLLQWPCHPASGWTACVWSDTTIMQVPMPTWVNWTVSVLLQPSTFFPRKTHWAITRWPLTP